MMPLAKEPNPWNRLGNVIQSLMIAGTQQRPKQLNSLWMLAEIMQVIVVDLNDSSDAHLASPIYVRSLLPFTSAGATNEDSTALVYDCYCMTAPKVHTLPKQMK